MWCLMPSGPSISITAHHNFRAGVTLFAYGFRPFFLLAGIFAAVALPLSLAFYLGFGGDWLGDWPPGLFHAHEMIFGYTVAVIAGFLLTAAPGWQKTPPLTGGGLALLAFIWLAGRLALWSAGLIPPWMAALVDLSFIPALMVIGLPQLWALRAKRHGVFLVILGLMFAANGLIHAATAGYLDSALGLNLAVGILVLLITILGGRVAPGFTKGALKAAGLSDAVKTSPRLAVLAIAVVSLMIVADGAATLWPQWPGLDLFAALTALAAAAISIWRMAGWATRHVLDKPIVWVLHLGYGWLALGLALKGFGGLGWLDAASATHGFTIGAVGTMTLAIMTRAALGHTGRPLIATPLTVAAYLLVSLAAIARVVGTEAAMMLAASAWTAAFVGFTIVYAPIFLKPRPDGQPG